MIDRRRFAFMGLAGLAAASFSSVFLGGCSVESIWVMVQGYVPVGIAAFEAILALVAPVMSPFLNTIAMEVQAAFSVLAAAINQYISAPATSKATLAQKVALALNDLIDNLQKFAGALGQGSNPIVTLATKLLAIIVSTLLSFVGSITTNPTPAARVRQIINVGAVRRSKKQFITEFNETLKAGGHSELSIH